MITETGNKAHQKHAKLPRPALGEWGRTEIALLGAPCSVLQDFANQIIYHCSDRWKIAFVDADHQTNVALPVSTAAIRFTDKISYKRIDFVSPLSTFQKHALFNDCDLVLINGNHFRAQQQIVFIDPAKSLESKLDRLTSVKLVLLKDTTTTIPDYIKTKTTHAPVLLLPEIERIISFLENYMHQCVASLRGLVLTGGKSTRMGTDKSVLNYHGQPQYLHVYELLRSWCKDVFLSCQPAQYAATDIPKIEDHFLGIGPLGGILSAFQTAPDQAWLTVAGDMPYLNAATLEYLVAHRNPSKLATAFMDESGRFPEPLITIWEPRAYPVLLQALSAGYSCPRKVLMNTDVETLQAPDVAALQNVNDPAAYERAVRHFKSLSFNQ